MAKPDPETGLVIRYDYLWNSRKEKGHEVGELRPCVVVFVAPNGRVVVCPITHSELAPKEWRVELPQGEQYFSFVCQKGSDAVHIETLLMGR
jgi:mRNA-degrading endonuclease toxin of MazEF toxin-antitoxin module